MKDQNKNQKAPETKLTDAQLGEVNAGVVTGLYNASAKQEGYTTIGLAADEKPTINISIGQAKSQLQGII